MSSYSDANNLFLVRFRDVGEKHQHRAKDVREKHQPSGKDDLDLMREILKGYGSILVHVKKDFSLTIKNIENNAAQIAAWNGRKAN